MFVILKIDRHVHRLIQTAMDSGPVTTPTIPYIRSTPETYGDWLLMSGTKTNRSTDREQYTRSNAATNLSTRLTEHKRATTNGDVNNHIAEQHLQTKHQIDWDSATCRLLSTSHFRKLSGLLTQRRTNDLLTRSSKINYERTTGELTI